jgi:hypothetical protein
MRRLSKSQGHHPKRQLGLYRGQIWMSPDFDDPWELVETPEEWELRHENSDAAEEPAGEPKPKNADG